MDGWRRVKIATVSLLIAAIACGRRAQPSLNRGRGVQGGGEPVAVTVPNHEVLRPLPVGGDVKPPVAITRVEPKLPKRLDRAGPLLLAATIDRNGVVRDVRVIRDGTIPRIGPLYAAAIKQWRFKPGTLRGEPVDVEYNLSVIIDVR